VRGITEQNIQEANSKDWRQNDERSYKKRLVQYGMLFLGDRSIFFLHNHSLRRLHFQRADSFHADGATPGKKLDEEIYFFCIKIQFIFRKT
jgi:hypothetical protein